MVNNAKLDDLPDYSIKVAGSKVTFINREEDQRQWTLNRRLKLSDIAFEDARAVAPGWDVYVLEEKWRAWALRISEEGGEAPRDPDRAFVGFCRRWAEKKSLA